MPSPKLIRRILLTALPLIVLGGTGLYLWKNNSPKTYEVEDNRFLLDTVVSIRLYNSRNPENLEKAFERISEYEQLLSRHHNGSDLSKINSAAPGIPTEVSPDTIELMTTAIRYAALSAGRFDPSVGPLVDLWGIGSEAARVPGKDEITSVLPLVNYRRIQVDPDSNTITLENEGMALDLGAIAKGWIADRTIEYLRENGEEHILVNLGGNVMVSGGKPDGTPFKIGMQNPLSDRGEYLGVFSLADGSVVSSGNYERFMESDGVRYHHILDTKTGYPAENGLASVTIISDHSVDGDALSTTLFILGIDEGFKLLEGLPGIEAAFTTKDNRVVMTSGAADIFQATVPNLQMEVRN